MRNSYSRYQAFSVRGKYISCLLLLLAFSLQVWAQVSSYSYRKRLKIDNTKVSGTTDLTNFPVLIDFTNTDLKAASQGGKVENYNGYDIRFADEDGSTLLNHQLESYDPTTGHIVAWVELPTLKASSDTYFYIYYGRPGAIDPSTADTWDTNYQMVLHLNGSLQDETTHENNATNNGTTVTSSSKIGSGRTFIGNSFIQVADNNSLDITGQITISAWINPSNASSGPDLITKGNWNEAYSTYIQTNRRLRFITNGGGNLDSDMSLSNGNWHYLVFTKTASGRAIYINGEEHGTSNNNNDYNTNNNPLSISSAQYSFRGKMDEVRISNTSYSADWINTEYQNQNDPVSFISETGEAPVLSGIENTELNYLAGSGPQQITTMLGISVFGSSTISQATVKITGNYNNGQDILSFANQNGITGSWNTINGTLTLSGTASISNYQTALQSVTYQNTSSNPNQSTRTISFTASNGTGVSVPATRNIIIAVQINDLSTAFPNVVFHFDAQDVNGNLQTNDQPVDGTSVSTWVDRSNAATSGGSPKLNFTAGNAPLFNSNYLGERGGLLFDGNNDFLQGPNNAILNNATFTSKTFALMFRTGDSVNGLQVIYEQGDDTRGYQLSIKDGHLYALAYNRGYNNGWANPWWNVNSSYKSLDLGVVSPNQSYILTAIHDDDTWEATVNNGALVSDNSASQMDASTGNPGIGETNGNTRDPVSFNSVDNTPFSGYIGELVSWNTTLSATQRADLYSYLNEKWFNAPPQLSNIEGTTVEFTEDDPPVSITSSLTVSDADNNYMDSARVAISTNFVFGEDVLHVTSTANITGSYNANIGVLRLTGRDTKANYQAMLRSVTYQNTNALDPSTSIKAINFSVYDWDDVSNTVTRNLQAKNINSAPSLANIETSNLNYNEGDDSITLTSSLTISDTDDSQIESATVQITGNYFQGEDILNVSDVDGITGTFNTSSGTLTLTGTSSTSNYQAILRSVTYKNISADPETQDRTVRLFVNDGDDNSNYQSRTISVSTGNTPPQITNLESSDLVYGAGDSPVSLTDSLTVVDFDDSNIESATVQISVNYDSSQDVLHFSDVFGISGNWNETTGTLALSGSASKSDYQSALRLITYENMSSNPSTPKRTVSFTINDGTDTSGSEGRNISVSVAGTISGLELWLKADAGIFRSPGGTAANNGQGIGEWQDQSGNGHNFSAAGTKPVLRTGVGLLNNQRAVEFAGNGDFLEDSNGENYINGLDQFTLFVVVKSDQTNTDHGFFDTQASDAQDDIFTIRYDAAGANAAATNLIKTGILNNDPAHQLESFSDVQTDSGQIVMLQWQSSNFFDLYVDGVLNNPSGVGSPPAGSISNATTVIVGKGAMDAGQSWDGMIAEVILYNRKLTDTERQSVEDYLSHKYDVSIRLITPATGGEAISADDANNPGNFTTLTGPVIREEFVEKLKQGKTIILKAPEGYQWDTGSTSPIATVGPAFGGATNLQVSFTSRTASEIIFSVNQASSAPRRPGKVTFGNLRVRPTTGILPNTGNITNTGTTGQGGTTNYGTLNIVAGARNRLAFLQQPSTTSNNKNISPSVRIQLIDQYGNTVSDKNVNIGLSLSSGTGTLSGTTTKPTNALGVVEFSDLQIDQTGTKTLTASSTGLSSKESNPFDIVTPGQFVKFLVERPSGGIITTKTAGQSFDIKISAVDANGNIDAGFNGTTTVSSTGTVGTGAGTTANFVNGVLNPHTMNITSTGTGIKIIATNSNGPETGESNEFPVTSGAPSKNTTTITASPEVILNDGLSTSTITVQLKDVYGNNLTTGSNNITLNTTEGTLSSITDNNDGIYTAILTSSNSQTTATITGTVNGNNIVDKAHVSFTMFSAIWEGSLGDQLTADQWEYANNWNTNTVPGPNDIVLIPGNPEAGNKFPVVSITNQTVGQAVIEAGADITVSGGVNFIIKGSLTGSGEVNGSNTDTLTIGGNVSIPSLPIGTLQLNGSMQQTITRPHTYTSLIINNTSAEGVSVSDNLFVNSTLSLTNGTLTIPSGKNLIANTKNIGSGQLNFERIISGIIGWRMISSPVASTYADLLDSTVTQGYQNAFYDSGTAPNDTLQANVLYYDETYPGTDNQRWRTPEDADDALIPGQGLFVYFFGDVPGDERYNNSLPDTLSVKGQEFEGNGSEFNFNVTYTAEADTGWNFIGNPFGATLNWDAPGWTKTNIDNTIYVWDPDANGGNGAFMTWNGSTGTLGNGLIAPFQGFWIKANGPGPVLKVRKNNKTTGGAFKRKETDKEIYPVSKITVSNGYLTGSTSLVFQNGANTGKDINDGYRLLPFTDSFLDIYTSFTDGTQLAINNLPGNFDQRVLIPLYVEGYEDQQTTTGPLKLSWPGFRNIPSNWVITLVDNQTGDQVNMLQEDYYMFEMNSKAKAGTYKTNSRNGHFKLKEKSSASNRFTIRISTEEIESEIPQQTYLKQNYPNPFNSTTKIEFGLDKDTDVKLVVYDILGRKIKTLISDKLGAGKYNFSFEATGLASGVYLYRLVAGKKSYVKKLTFIK